MTPDELRAVREKLIAQHRRAFGDAPQRARRSRFVARPVPTPDDVVDLLGAAQAQRVKPLSPAFAETEQSAEARVDAVALELDHGEVEAIDAEAAALPAIVDDVVAPVPPAPDRVRAALTLGCFVGAGVALLAAAVLAVTTSPLAGCAC